MRTVPFGRLYEPYMDADEYYEDSSIICDSCGEEISPGDSCYCINYRYFCSHCTDAARDEIFECEKDNYMIRCQ